jgi:hypothetical protein
MTYAGGAHAACGNSGHISSTTATGGETSSQHYGRGIGKATKCKAGRCHHVQISELLSMAKCDQEVVDFLAATYIWKVPPKLADEPRQEEHDQNRHGKKVSRQDSHCLNWGQYLSVFVHLLVIVLHNCVHMIDFLCHRKQQVAGGCSAILPAHQGVEVIVCSVIF